MGEVFLWAFFDATRTLVPGSCSSTDSKKITTQRNRRPEKYSGRRRARANKICRAIIVVAWPAVESPVEEWLRVGKLPRVAELPQAPLPDQL